MVGDGFSWPVSTFYFLSMPTAVYKEEKKDISTIWSAPFKWLFFSSQLILLPLPFSKGVHTTSLPVLYNFVLLLVVYVNDQIMHYISILTWSHVKSLFELFLLNGLTMNYVGIIKKTREKIISLFPVHKFENITFVLQKICILRLGFDISCLMMKL